MERTRAAGRMLVLGVLSALALAVSVAPAQAQPRPVTIDLSTVGTGSLPHDAFNRQGLMFDWAGGVSVVAGDEALLSGGRIAGTFNGTVDELAVRVVPIGPAGPIRMVADITLTARDEGGPIATDTARVTFAPEDGIGQGHLSLELADLRRPASAFEVSAQVVEASASWFLWLGLSEITFSLDEPEADVFPPVVTVPSPVRLNATSPLGAVATHAVRVTDNRDPEPTLTCTPPSGSAVPIGTTIVFCTARDAADNVSEPRSFPVEVRVVGHRLPHRGRDHVVGFGTINGAQHFRLFAEASPTGRNARGWMSATGFYTLEARITCLRVEGNRAAIGGEITRGGANRLGRGVVVIDEDNGDGEDPTAYSTSSSRPTRRAHARAQPRARTG